VVGAEEEEAVAAEEEEADAVTTMIIMISKTMVPSFLLSSLRTDGCQSRIRMLLL